MIKRLYKTKTSVAKAKAPYQAKASLAKAKMRLPSQNTSLLGLPSEGENALTERKHSTKRRNRVYGAKMSLATAFTERKRGSLR